MSRKVDREFVIAVIPSKLYGKLRLIREVSVLPGSGQVELSRSYYIERQCRTRLGEEFWHELPIGLVDDEEYESILGEVLEFVLESHGERHNFPEVAQK